MSSETTLSSLWKDNQEAGHRAQTVSQDISLNSAGTDLLRHTRTDPAAGLEVGEGSR